MDQTKVICFLNKLIQKQETTCKTYLSEAVLVLIYIYSYQSHLETKTTKLLLKPAAAAFLPCGIYQCFLPLPLLTFPCLLT